MNLSSADRVVGGFNIDNCIDGCHHPSPVYWPSNHNEEEKEREKERKRGERIKETKIWNERGREKEEGEREIKKGR